MSKLSFRARALDASKPLPIYRAEEIRGEPSDCSLINRAVPQMPTGMEKEEESEHHLQQAIVAGTVIPTPEVFVVDADAAGYYDKFYPENYKLPRQLIYMQPFSMETDIPDYDMDSEDEQWVKAQSGKLELTPEKFEEMMDRLEKGSGQTVVTLQEAKALIKEDDDLIIAVYDYWLNKRLKTQQPLIPHVRTEARHGIANHNPYIAFRRRTEKMQTRKNRKNDESSYEKMLKLRRDLSRAVNLLEMVKKREKSKRELLHLTIEVFEKRTQAGDFSGQIVNEALQQRPARPAFTPLYQANSLSWIKEDPSLLGSLSRKERRQYKKRRHKSKGHGASGSHAASLNYLNAQGLDGEVASSEDDLQPASPSDGEEEDEGVFAFKRKKDCEYLAPLDVSDGPLQLYTQEETEKRLKFYPTAIPDSLNGTYRAVGPCRRRIGRGGRMILDRMTISDLKELCQAMGYKTRYENPPSPPPAVAVARKSPEPSTSASVQQIPELPVIKEELPPPPPPPPETPVEEVVEPDIGTLPLGCWNEFRPQPLDILDTGEWLYVTSPEPSEDEDEDDESGPDQASLAPAPVASASPILQPSYHLGLVVSNGDRPLTFPLDTLMSDPSLTSLPSHVEAAPPNQSVLLDEQTSELENTYYLMELNNDILGGVGLEADPLFSSMDVDSSGGGRCSEVDGGSERIPPTNPPGPGPPPPPPASSASGGSSNPQQNPSNSSADSSGQGSSTNANPSSSSSSSTPPVTQNQPDSSPETAVVNVGSSTAGEGSETGGNKSDTDAAKSRELSRFALLISV